MNIKFYKKPNGKRIIVKRPKIQYIESNGKTIIVKRALKKYNVSANNTEQDEQQISKKITETLSIIFDRMCERRSFNCSDCMENVFEELNFLRNNPHFILEQSRALTN